jgi:hypothetical protein
MTDASRDTNKIQSELEAVEEYQAPLREHEQDTESAPPPSGADDPIDVSLLEAQQGRRQPGMSETKPYAAPDPKSTVSTQDELADPADPRATPPGERM